MKKSKNNGALRRAIAQALERRVLLSDVMAPIATAPLMPAGPAGTVTPLTTAAPTGITPSQMRTAYGISSISFNGTAGTGAGQTIAIVDAYNDPNIQSDLASFDSYFGLSAPPSFTVMSQTGSTTSLPAANSGWITEIALDVEWAHAIAPGASIDLVSSVSLNFTMLVMLSQNYSKPGTFATGDLNGDGVVNFADLVLLSQNYNKTLPPADYLLAASSSPMQLAQTSNSAVMPALFPLALHASATTTATVAQTTGSIAGSVFNDANGDGIQEKGEAGLAGRSVYLRIPGAATRGQRIAITNSAGQFSFTNVPAGSYLVVISQPAGWRSTTSPADSFALTLAPGAAVGNLAFGQTQAASISGNVSLAPAMSGLAGWTVSLTNSANAKLGYSAVTDAQGNYTIPSAPAGTYTLAITTRQGYAPSTPAGGRYTLHVYAAQTLTGKNFGVTTVPVTITAVRTVDPLNKAEDIVTFYALDNATGALAGSSKLLAEDLTLTCSSGLEIRTYDGGGTGVANDADFTGLNATPTASFIRLGGPSFFVAGATPSASSGTFVDHQLLGSFEVAGALLTGGVPATAGTGAQVAAAVVKHGASVTLAGNLAAEVGAPVAVSYIAK